MEIIDKCKPLSISLNECEITKAKIECKRILGHERISDLFRFYLNHSELITQTPICINIKPENISENELKKIKELLRKCELINK